MEDWDPGSRCKSMSMMSEHNLNLEEALGESRRWIEAVTGKHFKYADFRQSVADGVIFCELIQNIKRGSIRKINRLPTAFAGMDNFNVFLKACEKEFGLSGSQLFHAGDLQDLSHRASFSIPERKKELERRLKNVCGTLYWLGKKAQQTESFVGPYLNLDVFSTLLFDGNLSLKDTSSSGVSSMDCGDPTNNNRFSFGGSDDVFSTDGSLDFSNIAPKSYEEPDWKRNSSIGDNTEPEVTVKAVFIEQASVEVDVSRVERQSVHSTVVTAVPRQAIPSTEGLVAAVPRQAVPSTEGLEKAAPRRSSRMERRMHPNALKPHMRSQSVPEQMMGGGSMDDEEPEQEMWMSSLSSWKNRRMRATSSERARKALQDEVQEHEQGRQRRKSKTFREIVEEKERREKELQDTWNTEHGGEEQPKRDGEGQELENILTTEPQGYASDGEQNNNEEIIKNSKGKVRPRTLPKSFKQKKVRPTILKPEPVTATSAPREENSPPARAPADPHKQKLRQRYGSAFRPYTRSSTNGSGDTVDAIVPQQADNQYSSAPGRPKSMSFHDKLVQERELDQKMEEERRDIHSKTREANAKKTKRVSSIMSKIRAFDRGEADVPKEEKKPTHKELIRQRSMSRPFSEMTVCINQRPRSETGFGFTVEGGVDKDRPIEVTQVESGGPADLSELRVKDEIVAINGEKVKPFTHDDFMYCISQAVLSGSLTLKVRRYDNEGIQVRQSTARRFSDLIPTFNSDSAAENQSSDPTEVISPSRARAMFSQMEQRQGTMSPDSQRSVSPKQTPSPKHTPSPKLHENHKEVTPPPVNRVTEKTVNDDQSMPYKEFQRLAVDPAHSPSTSPFSDPDEIEDRDLSWVQDKAFAGHSQPIESKISPDEIDDRDQSRAQDKNLVEHPQPIESKVSPVNEPSEVFKGGTTQAEDDMEWLRNLEEIEKEAFGFIEAQGVAVKEPEKTEPEKTEPEKTLQLPEDNRQLNSSEEETVEDEIMDRLEKEAKQEEALEELHKSIEEDELNKSAIKESPIQRVETQPEESSMPYQPSPTIEEPQQTIQEPQPPLTVEEPQQPRFKAPQPTFKAIIPITNLGPKPYKPMAPESYKGRSAQPVFLREKDIREKVKADMYKRRSDFFSKSLDASSSKLMFGRKADLSPSSSGRSSPVEEPFRRSMDDLLQQVEQPATESQPPQPAQAPAPIQAPTPFQAPLRHNSRPKSIHGMPSRKTFNLEEERKRLEKWQGEQERLRQEQYEQEQRRLKEQRERGLQRAEEEERKRQEAEQNAMEERQKKLQQQAEERLILAREEEERQRFEQERLEEERRERKTLQQEAAEQYPTPPVEDIIQPQIKQDDFAMPGEDPHEPWQKEQEEIAQLQREHEERRRVQLEQEKAERERLQRDRELADRERLQREHEEAKAREQERLRLQREREHEEAKARELEQLRLQREQEHEEAKAREQERLRLQREREEHERREKEQEIDQEHLKRLREEEIDRIRAEEREKLRREWEDLQRERALQEVREKDEMERLKQLRAEQERLRQERMLLEQQQAEERRQLELEKERLRKLAAQPFGSRVEGKMESPVERPLPEGGDAPPRKAGPAEQPHMSKFRDPNAPSQQHWLVEEAERRRLADKTGAGRVSPFVHSKDTMPIEPVIEKNNYEPVESAPSYESVKDHQYPMDPPTRIAPPRDPQASGDYDMPSHPYESQPSQPVVRRPRRKEADEEKKRKMHNRRSLPTDVGNRGDAPRMIGGEMTPPLEGSAPAPDAIIETITRTQTIMPLQVGTPQPAYYRVNTQMTHTQVVNTQGVMMVAPVPNSAAYATYNWETAPQGPMYAYDPEDFTARNATAVMQDTSSQRYDGEYDSDGNEML